MNNPHRLLSISAALVFAVALGFSVTGSAIAAPKPVSPAPAPTSMSIIAQATLAGSELLDVPTVNLTLPQPPAPVATPGIPPVETPALPDTLPLGPAAALAKTGAPAPVQDPCAMPDKQSSASDESGVIWDPSDWIECSENPEDGPVMLAEFDYDNDYSQMPSAFTEDTGEKEECDENQYLDAGANKCYDDTSGSD